MDVVVPRVVPHPLVVQLHRVCVVRLLKVSETNNNDKVNSLAVIADDKYSKDITTDTIIH